MKLEGKKQLEVDDIILNYYEKGEGDTIIFIHGNGMSSKIFSKMYFHFSKKYNVIAIDSRGQGLSSAGKKRYSLSLFAEDIIKFCSIKKIKKAIVIGYSDGANIALLIAKKAPKLIKKMVVISGNFAVNGIHTWFILLIKIYKKILLSLKKYYRKSEKKIWLLDLMLKDIGIEENDLRNINIPTLILCADLDVVYDFHTITIHKNIKGSFLRKIRNCTHANIVNKKNSLKEIDKFLLKDTIKENMSAISA
ncbi:alpha/beta fold hydrolase [Clostridium massiliamazoniense]|uniref:alpha/beta fold hydrolase n=1 Tax=Clostridium massiliamazoniense TaxID=1347366 RepID=UPI0006D825FA|nr:alpha/beta hydrolase [Clostridium massiliamazoniense]